jgi:hypothetical protein
MRKGIVEREVGGDIVLYDTERDSVHVLNETAREIRRLHASGLSPEEIERLIREQCRADEDRDVLADVRQCLEDLRARGLLP